MAGCGAPAEGWWSEAVVYQVYVRSFADSGGDGVGDLPGITARLDHIADLGCDALWLTPCYPSPMADGGYDVADPRDIDPLFGTLADFDALAAAAHRRGLRVLMDIVPNHTSSQHPRFRAALAGDEAARAWYVFRKQTETNNWKSVFGGPAWTPVGDGTSYLHLFAAEQPDLDWTNPDVLADLRTTLRFWAARGADGFRFDVAHGLAKAPGLPDSDLPGDDILPEGRDEGDPRFDQPEVHRIWREVRKTLDETGTFGVGEVWVPSPESLARYVSDDELNLTFDFRLLLADWDAAELRGAIEGGLAVARQSWVLENHDRDRLERRYGGGARGASRALAMDLVLLALPGPVFLYQGQELGLPQVDLPDEVLADPIWERSGHTQRGRDGERVPLPWSGSAPPFGFGPGATAWLPQPPEWAALTAARQAADRGSALAMHRTALASRRARLSGPLEWLDAGGPQVVVFRRGEVVVALNAGTAPVLLTAAALGLSGPAPLEGLASAAFGAGAPAAAPAAPAAPTGRAAVQAGYLLAPDTAVWLVSS